MVCLDPLDKEIPERALRVADAPVLDSNAVIDLESDEELEEALRRELIDVIHSTDSNDAEALRDLVLTKQREAVSPQSVIEASELQSGSQR